MKEVNRNLTEEEDSTQCSKFLTQITIKKTTLHYQGFKTFCQRKLTSEALTS